MSLKHILYITAVILPAVIGAGAALLLEGLGAPATTFVGSGLVMMGAVGAFFAYIVGKD